MKKLTLFLALTCIFSNVAFCAFHSVGQQLSLNGSQTNRHLYDSNHGSIANINTQFILKADAYNNLPVDTGNMTNESIFAVARVYWPQYINNNTNVVGEAIARVDVALPKPTPSSKQLYNHDVKVYTTYRGYACHWAYIINVEIPTPYSAMANAYIEWND
jgi:hypothetical protein